MHPIIAKIGPLTIYSYGMMVAIAYAIGMYVAQKEALRKGISKNLMYDFAFYVVIGSLVGARLYYVAFFNPRSFIEEPLSLFKIWEGGLAIHGAILGGIITGIVFARFRKISFWDVADTMSPSLLLGQAIGRLGCFLNGCCFGTPTDSIWGVRFPKESLPDFTYHGLRLHPVQLYELILNVLGFFALWFLRKRMPFKGGLFLAYLAMYALVRLIVSPFRGDNLYIWSTNIKIADVLSAVMLVVVIIVFIRKAKHA